MEIEISFKTKSNYFNIETIEIQRLTNNSNSLYTTDTLTYLTCPVDRIKSEKSLRHFVLKKNIHPALKEFLELGVGDTEDELIDIKIFCEKYGLLLDIKSYTKMLSESMGYKIFSDSYDRRLCPKELADTISMPLCLFKFYKKLFNNICDLHKHIGCLKQSSSQNSSLIGELISSYFDLLLQPYFLELPEPFNHHFFKIHPLARFSVHYATYIKKHCLDNKCFAPNTFWKIAKKAFRLNTGYKEIASKPGHGTVLLQRFSSTEFVELPRLETCISYSEKDPFDYLTISYLFAQDLISNEYEDIFSVIIPTIMKHGCLKIEPDYSINVSINTKNRFVLEKLIEAITKSGMLLIQQILSSYTYGLSLQSSKDEDLNNIMILNIENLLQFLAINLLNTIENAKIRKCIHKNCNRHVLSLNNTKDTIASRCCSQHYEAQQKYMRRHNLTIENYP